MTNKTPQYDAKVKAILDSTKPGERVCALTGEKWIMTDEEIGWYKKFQKPPSKYSPTARIRLLTSFLSGYQWWNNKHAETGKPVLSGVHPATGIKVLPDKEWFTRDFQEMAKEFDPLLSFFDQLKQLQFAVPYSASRNYVEPENSICMASFGDQNSYFVVACQSKDSFYSVTSQQIENSAECYQCHTLQDSYNVIFSSRIFNCRFVQSSFDCLNSAFLFDCRNCENCFGATNRRNVKYVWFNEHLTKEEWEKRYKEVDFGSRAQTKKLIDKFDALMKTAVWPENFNEKQENSTGEYLIGTVDCKHVYMAPSGGRNNYWCVFALRAPEGNAFCAGPVGSQDCYYMAGSHNSFRCYAMSFCSRVQDCEYCIQCYDCEHCFGCVGLRNKKFCIFNKPYTEEGYWRKVDEIKCLMFDREEYGEYLPADFSTFYFPESGAVMYCGAEPQDGKQYGGHMFDPESDGAYGDDNVDPSKVRMAKDVPDSIDMLTDDWIGVPILDPEIRRRFVILKSEAEFYRRLRIAPPVTHFTRRVRDLYYAANIGDMRSLACAKCQKEIIIARNRRYPDRVIYCRPCYLKYLEKQ